MTARMLVPAWLGALSLAVAAGLVGGCYETVSGPPPEPEPRPTAAVLREMRAAPYPVYWLGPRFRGRELTAARVVASGAIARYGRPVCGSESCGYAISVISGPRGRDSFPQRGELRSHWGQICFRSLRGALLMMCPGNGEWELFTGQSDISITIDYRRPDELDVVHGLVPMNAAASSRRLLPPPRRLSCDEYDGLADWFVAKLPRVLRPERCA
jgi:hypothetical protein